MRTFGTRSATALALVLGLAAPAIAQDNEGDEQETRQLSTVTVTAQRTEETLQDAAIPVNAATGDELVQAGVADATALGKIAPALSVTNGGGANTAYFVRGVGNFTNNGYTAPAIAFNLDGVYIGRPSSTIASFLDLNRVEVLKGPQGTLYGRNSTGGAVNVIPNVPVIGDTSGSINVGAGNYSSYEASGVANFAVGENSAIRLAGIISGRDGYFDDGTGDAEDVALRAQYLVEPSEDLSIRLSADYSTQGGEGAGVAVYGAYGFAPFNPQLDVPNWAFTPSNIDPFTGLQDANVQAFIEANATAAPLFSPVTGYAPQFRDDTYWGVNAEINYDFGGHALVIIPSYRYSELDNQFNGPPFKAAINQDEAEQYSIEARLSGSLGANENVDYILGAYYFDETVEGVNSFNQFSTSSFNDFTSDTESTALFARGTFHVSDQLRLVGGVRYTDEQRAIDVELFSVAGICFRGGMGPPNCDFVPTIPVGLTAADSLAQLEAQGLISSSFIGGSPLNNGVVSPGFYQYGTVQLFPPPAGEVPGGPAALSITPTIVNRSGGDEEFTYRAALEYDFTPDNLFYVSFETGFRAGGFNQSIGNEEYDPEFIDAWTVGSKNRFMNNTLEVNLEAFFWEYEDQQLAALGLDANGNNSFFTRNVGSSTIQGAEIDFQYAATANTLLRGSVQYLDATYDEYSFNQVDLSDEAVDPPGFLTPVTGCQTTLLGFDGDLTTPTSYDIDCSGNDALNAPEWTITGGIQQMFDLGSFELQANADVRYRSEREVGFNYVPGGRAEAVTTGDLSVTVLPDEGSWNLTAYVRNVSDEAINATYQLGAGNVAGAALEPPRTFGVRVGVDF